jgi:hypothetical protein
MPRRRPAAAGTAAVRIAQLIGGARIAVGVVAVLAPSAFPRYLARVAPRHEVTVPVRILGARDLALGMGAVLAAREGATPELRRWVEASALADAVDALAFVRAGTFPALPRAAAIVAATGATVLGGGAARQLPRR